MSARIVLSLAGLLALAAIVAGAAAVIDKPSRQPQAVLVTPPDYASPVEVDERPAADPDAKGVIAGLVQGRLLTLTPQGESLSGPAPFSRRDGLSHDGYWLAVADCKDTGCSLVIGASAASWSTQEATVSLQAPFLTGEWAPQASIFAALDNQGRLYLVNPETRTARAMKSGVTAFAWTAGDRLILATVEAGRTSLVQMQTTGAWSELARVDAPVSQLFPSQDLIEFAFAQDAADGWRMLSVNAEDGSLRDFGNLGADSSQADAPAFAIAWSPDRSYLAVGPVIEPFTLHVLQPGAAGAQVSRFALEKGFAGELKWSPDGSRLAISTYSPNRVWHEVFVLGMDNLEAGPRFLLDGCEIVWSPDGLFVAVKREASRAQAMAAIRVDTGDYWHVSNLPYLVPVAWGLDAEAAEHQATQPVRRSGQLGK